MKITTKEIATICGVSRGTVDRALNDRPGINLKTKEKILRVVNELGYRPHLLARSLVKGSTKTIGVVVFNLKNRFFSQLVNAIENRLREYNYFMYLTLTNKNPDEEIECLNKLASLNVDGLILSSVNKGNEFIQYLNSIKIPIITITNIVSKNIPYVGINDSQAAKDATNYILSNGYKQIVYISPPLKLLGKVNLFSPEQRLQGFQQVFKDMPKSVKHYKIIKGEYILELDKLLKNNKNKIAVFCSSDVYALEVLNHLKNSGLKVPDDVGLMGFDNIDTLRYVDPSLATINYHIEEIGHRAVDLLIKQIKGEKVPYLTYINHNIIHGKSLINLDNSS